MVSLGQGLGEINPEKGWGAKGFEAYGNMKKGRPDFPGSDAWKCYKKPSKKKMQSQEQEQR